MSLRSPLSRVLGSGSAKDGTRHWWIQRATAVGLLMLGLWFLVSFAALDDYRHADLLGWAARPINATLLLIAGVTLAWHSSLGMQVVIEDYVHQRAVELVMHFIVRAGTILGAVTGVIHILKLTLGAG